MPNAIVIDAGTISGRTWASVELNGAWSAGIYGSDPVLALETIRPASRKAA